VNHNKAKQHRGQAKNERLRLRLRLSGRFCTNLTGGPNTVYLERATATLQGHGREVDTSLLQHLSPLGWEHINLTGDYVWRSSAKVGAGKFRLLRPLPGA